MAETTDTYDYIIVGAGSAGCTLAYHLSREASRKVLLLEAGDKDTFPMIHIPLGFAFMMKNPRVNWCYETEPEPNMHHRRVSWPRGKVLGGTSCINGMVYIRGQQEDYDHWAALGNKGWSFDEVLPYFKRSEYKAEGANEWHGRGGHLWVEKLADDVKMELGDIFIQAATQVGIPFNEDFNVGQQEGVGYYDVNIKRGRRQSTAKTYLAACKDRPNLHVVTNAHAHRVLLKDGQAIGVEYEITKGKKNKAKGLIKAHCKQEVVLCGGAINSPQLLELSGIGDTAHLEKVGVPVKHHLPGVGENLQDHLTVHMQQGLEGVDTFYEETRPAKMLKNILKYFATGKGLLANPASQIGVFFRSNDEVDRANSQVHFTPAASEVDSKGNLQPVPGTTATVCNMRPESRGSVHIKSEDPLAAPAIRANYLSTENDRKVMVEGVRKIREIFAAPALAKRLTKELAPGKLVETDEEILDFVAANGESVYHPVGTCKMGHDEMAVVDDRLRVHGLKGLRVADASIMPKLISGNTNAPAVMIAEKCADMMLEDAGIGRSRAPVTAATQQDTTADSHPHSAPASDDTAITETANA